MELIQAPPLPPPHFSPHKQAAALTYSNRRSNLSLDTRPVPKSGAGTEQSEKELEKEN